MAHKPSQRCRSRKAGDPEINIVPAMSLMIILIPFLLLTAVFGRASILSLYMPTEGQPQQSQAEQKNQIIPTVAVTQKGFILSRKKGDLVRIPREGEEYNFDRLRDLLLQLRNETETSDNIIILPEIKVSYQLLISTMDTCREYRDENDQTQPLFPIISLGEYRASVASSGVAGK